MIIQSTRVWELSLATVDPSVRRTLSKAYGSKRSGTIYLVADSEGEAIEVAREMFRMSGYKAPDPIYVAPTHLIPKALRAVY